MQAYDIDPNYGGFRSGSFRLWPWTPPKANPPVERDRQEDRGRAPRPGRRTGSEGGRP